MKLTSPNNVSRIHFGFVLALGLAFSTLAVLLGLNLERIDRLVGAFLSWDGGSGSYVACYDDFLLTVSSDNAFEFSSGRGQSSLSKFRIQFSDGTVFSLPKLTPVAVESYFPDADKTTLTDKGQTIVRYGIGFDSFDFVNSELEGVTLSEDSQIAIDFGDGQFVKLPVERKKLLKLLGPPNEWEKVRGGPP